MAISMQWRTLEAHHLNSQCALSVIPIVPNVQVLLSRNVKNVRTVSSCRVLLVSMIVL
jgi:hypothetical protein